MKLLVALTVFTVALAAYVTMIRPWMRKTAAGAAFLDKIEPLERVLWWKSETILWSRFKTAIGAILTAAVAFDWAAVSPVIPDKYRQYALLAPTVFVALDGLIGEWLRRDTTKPLEVVGMRTDAPEQIKALAAGAAKANAAAVEMAKETGAV